MVVKDPDTRLDYAFDWATAYPEGQAVTGSTWSVTPQDDGGVSVLAGAHDLQRTTVTLEGGISGRVYRVSNRVTLSDGQVDERSMTIRVEER